MVLLFLAPVGLVWWFWCRCRLLAMQICGVFGFCWFVV